MWNTRLDELQAGIKIAGRNNNNLRYGEDTALMAEIKEELKSLLMRVKEESEKESLGKQPPRWSSGYNSTFQCGGLEFSPWLGN